MRYGTNVVIELVLPARQLPTRDRDDEIPKLLTIVVDRRFGGGTNLIGSDAKLIGEWQFNGRHPGHRGEVRLFNGRQDLDQPPPRGLVGTAPCTRHQVGAQLLDALLRVPPLSPPCRLDRFVLAQQPLGGGPDPLALVEERPP